MVPGNLQPKSGELVQRQVILMLHITHRFLSVCLIGFAAFLALFPGIGTNLYADDSTLYTEALQLIKQNSLIPPPLQSSSTKIPLKNLLRGIDRFSDYLTPEEYAAFLQSQKSIYIGIGMQVEKKTTGKIICIPYPGYPADLAGIKFGDILVAVNGEKTENKSVYSIASMTKGSVGTRLVMSIQDSKGREKTIALIRRQIQVKSVSFLKLDNVCLITIARFTPGTTRDLKVILDEIAAGCPVIIDLRGNPGGDLNSAIDCAMLFLDKGQEIVEVRRRYGTKKYHSTTPASALCYPVTLFQGKKTASAAEVFSAALTQNQKAVSIGENTYGKGVVQDIFQLSDGSALFLTTGYLIPPSGIKYHGKGCAPDYPVSGSQLEQFVQGVKSLVKNIPSTSLLKDNKTKRKEISPKEKSEKKVNFVHPRVTSDNQFFACFDRKFTSHQEAVGSAFKWWKTSGQILREPYFFQDSSSGMISYLVCVGPLSTRRAIEKQRSALGRKVGIPMVIKTFNEDKPLLETTSIYGEIPQKIPKRPAAHSWYIQAGSYKSTDGAIAELTKIKEKQQIVPLCVDITAPLINQDGINRFKKKFEEQGFKVANILTPEKKRRNDLVFRIFVGPYPSKNTKIMGVLKKGKIIPEDAFWYRSVQTEE